MTTTKKSPGNPNENNPKNHQKKNDPELNKKSCNNLERVEFWFELIHRSANAAFLAIKNVVGTEKGRELMKRGAGGDMSMFIDIESENKIIETLESGNTPFHLITEELGDKLILKDKILSTGCNDYIIVDPIDGSHNAAWGFPFSCISIAHASDSKLIDIDCAVVIDIYTGITYTAKITQGAFKHQKANESIRLAVNNNDKIRKSLFGINFSLEESLIDFSKRYSVLLSEKLKIRTTGSNCMSLCMLAQGSLDIFIDLQKKCRVLDIAAGYLLVKEAGGQFITPNGTQLNAKLSVNSRVSFLALNKGLVNPIRRLLPEIKEAFAMQPDYKIED
jgi:fructose-1,6-bisphosphatase/inositol monophosphatase family enzyme